MLAENVFCIPQSAILQVLRTHIHIHKHIHIHTHTHSLAFAASFGSIPSQRASAGWSGRSVRLNRPWSSVCFCPPWFLWRRRPWWWRRMRPGEPPSLRAARRGADAAPAARCWPETSAAFLTAQTAAVVLCPAGVWMAGGKPVTARLRVSVCDKCDKCDKCRLVIMDRCLQWHCAALRPVYKGSEPTVDFGTGINCTRRDLPPGAPVCSTLKDTQYLGILDRLLLFFLNKTKYMRELNFCWAIFTCPPTRVGMIRTLRISSARS